MPRRGPDHQQWRADRRAADQTGAWRAAYRPAHCALHIDQRIARHLKQPGAGVVDLTEPAALPHGLEKHLVQQVIRRVGIVQLVEQKAAQLGLGELPGLEHAGGGLGGGHGRGQDEQALILKLHRWVRSTAGPAPVGVHAR
ncbi:hypothetical protein THICB6_270001 [Thiomonas arsenitoxydans]|nr:hypothetical protein THICB6_270001 [Thiomonas arsenitoxydans]